MEMTSAPYRSTLDLVEGASGLGINNIGTSTSTFDSISALNGGKLIENGELNDLRSYLHGAAQRSDTHTRDLLSFSVDNSLKGSIINHFSGSGNHVEQSGSENQQQKNTEDVASSVKSEPRKDTSSASSYKDFSRIPKSDNSSVTSMFKQSSAKEPTFPAKLHLILSNPQFEDIVAWMPHGRSWRILKPDVFEDRVLPLFFCHCRLSSFMRQVNGWGFKRIKHGPDYNSYYNELFLRGLPHLVERMRRESVSAKSKGGTVEDEPAPDLYRISEENPLPENPPMSEIINQSKGASNNGSLGQIPNRALPSASTPSALPGVVSGAISGNVHGGMQGPLPVSMSAAGLTSSIPATIPGVIPSVQGSIPNMIGALGGQSGVGVGAMSVPLPQSYHGAHQIGGVTGSFGTQADALQQWRAPAHSYGALAGGVNAAIGMNAYGSASTMYGASNYGGLGGAGGMSAYGIPPGPSVHTDPLELQRRMQLGGYAGAQAAVNETTYAAQGVGGMLHGAPSMLPNPNTFSQMDMYGRMPPGPGGNGVDPSLYGR